MAEPQITVDASELAFILEDYDGNVARFLLGAVEDVTAGALFLEGKVKQKAMAKKVTGATGAYQDSIHAVEGQLEDQRITASVVADARHAPFVEHGTGPHRSRKSPMFWINVLEPWVHLVIRPSGGFNPVSGKKQTAEQAERSIAVGIGRKIEREGTEGKHIFAEVMEESEAEAFALVSDLLFDRLAAEIDAAQGRVA